MSLQWTIVAGFLYAEIFVCLLLCIPFISAKRWNSVFKSRLFGIFVSYANLSFITIISILCLLFADAIREVRKYSLPDAQQVNLSNNPNAQDHVLMMLFRAQRNIYISGFALFLFLVLRQMVVLISGTASLEANCEASKKQAESATRAAQALMENDDSSGDKVDKVELESLKTKLAEARSDLKSAEKNLEAMKSQAEATNKEYDRLMTEHANLQNELGEGLNKKDD